MKTNSDIDNRIIKLKTKLVEKKLDAALISSDVNVFYFSGFTGDSTEILITETANYLFTDFRYTEQVEKEAIGFTIIETKGLDRFSAIDEAAKRHGVKRLGIEKESVTLNFFERCGRELSCADYKDISFDISLLRSVKSPNELALMTQAADISDRVFEALMQKVKPGVTETELNAEMTYLFNLAGCGLSFTPIIASGENSALPHAPMTNRKLQNGDFLTIDFGCTYNQYCTDCTRTIGIGGLAKEQEKVYDIVKFAQEEAFFAVKPGVLCGDLDALARGIISDAGYAECFGHGLGHGVGLDIHEFPRVGMGDKTVLEPGMVITIEPGIYLKNRFGVRIEDMCRVTENGAESFNCIDKTLKII